MTALRVDQRRRRLEDLVQVGDDCRRQVAVHHALDATLLHRRERAHAEQVVGGGLLEDQRVEEVVGTRAVEQQEQQLDHPRLPHARVAEEQRVDARDERQPEQFDLVALLALQLALALEVRVGVLEHGVAVGQQREPPAVLRHRAQRDEVPLDPLAVLGEAASALAQGLAAGIAPAVLGAVLGDHLAVALPALATATAPRGSVHPIGPALVHDVEGCAVVALHVRNAGLESGVRVGRATPEGDDLRRVPGVGG
jgi:hypothetical protein